MRQPDEAESSGRLEEKLILHLKPRLLIGELGYSPFKTGTVGLFYRLVSICRES